MAEFKEMLEKLMEEKGWNRQELAEHYKVSKSQVTRWLDGQEPRLKIYRVIEADYLEATKEVV